MIDENETVKKIRNEDLMREVFEVQEGSQEFFLLKLFEVSGDEFYSIIHHENSCFFSEFLDCSRENQELREIRHEIFQNLSELVVKFKGKM